MWSGRGPAPVATVLELIVTAGTAAAVGEVVAATTTGVAQTSVNAQIRRLTIPVPDESTPARLSRQRPAPKRRVTPVVVDGRPPASAALSGPEDAPEADVPGGRVDRLALAGPAHAGAGGAPAHPSRRFVT
jgi:hypothetical protein